MDAMPMKAKEHFTHPDHPLEVFYAETEFLCDGCKTLGTDTRFRCKGCDFDLHDYCGTCPRSLSSFIHSHPLSLDVGMAQGMSQNEHFCDVCGEIVEGLCYQCKDCEFNVHPLCTQLPEQLCHALHTIHPLKLQKISSSRSCAVCRVCGGACDSWRYRCEICGFDIHMECLLVPCDHPPTQRTIPKCCPSTNPPQPPLAPPPDYGAYDPYRVSPCPNLYNTYNYVNQFQPWGQPPPLSQLLPYNGACPVLVPSPSPNNMYNHVNHDSPCGPPRLPAPPLSPPLPHYGAYPCMPSGPSPPPAPPHYVACIPSGPNPYNNDANQAEEGGATRGRKRKIYEIIKQLTLGLATNVIYGLLTGDFVKN